MVISLTLQETWLDIKTVAQLENRSERSVSRDVLKGKYGNGSRCVNGKGRGGNHYEIALESLPESLQARYRGEEKKQEDVLTFTGKQREEANDKAWIVAQYNQSGLSSDEFIDKFNSDNPPEDAITKSKLFRWQQKYKRDEVYGLIDRRGGHNKGETSIPPKAWECFYAIYMTQQKRSIQLCYDITKLDYPDIPSVSAFVRKVKTIPKYAIIYYREGPKAFKDSLPSMERTKLDIESNDIWFSDHHRIDVFVKSSDGKYAIRLWQTVFFDARSNKVISYIAREASPNATVVKQCFRLGVEKYGIPNEVYFDNGKPTIYHWMLYKHFETLTTWRTLELFYLEMIKFTVKCSQGAGVIDTVNYRQEYLSEKKCTTTIQLRKLKLYFPALIWTALLICISWLVLIA